MHALYYPYSRCVDENMLKYYMILYDSITFVDPLETDFREYLLFADKGCQFVPQAVHDKWNRTKETWEFFKEKNIVKFIDPSSIINEYDTILSGNLANDMANEIYLKRAGEVGKTSGPWKMLSSRIPNTVNRIIDDHESSEVLFGYKNKEENHVYSDYQIGVFAWELYDHHGLREFLLERLGGKKAQYLFREKDEIEKHFEKIETDPLNLLYISGGGTCEESGRPFGMHPYSYVNNVKYKNGEKIRILSFEQGSSLAISQAALIASIKSLVPVTDSLVHQDLLNIKFSQFDNLEKVSNNILYENDNYEIQKRQIIAQNCLHSIISYEELNKLSVEQIFKFREANLDSLQNFWDKMNEFSHEINTNSDNLVFKNEIIRLIDTKVIPEIKVLKDKMSLSKTKLFGDVLSKTMVSIPSVTTISVFAGLSISEMLIAGASGALAALGTSMPQIMEYRKNSKELNRNWISFLFQLKK
jgi:hypothetical protein